MLVQSGASNLSYFSVNTHDPLAELLAFGSAQGEDGATLGVRIEITTMMICTFFYGRSKNIGVLRSALLPFALYTTIFLHGLLPFLMQWSTEQLGLIYLYSDRLAAYYYLLFIPFLLSIIMFLSSKRYFSAFVKDLRFLRLAYYLLMLAIGLAFGLKNNATIVTIITVFEFLMVPIALVLAAVFAIVTNNIEDKKIDSISNPERPLFSSGIDEALYAKVGWWCLAGALFYAAMSGFRSFFTILFISATYYLYSAPPIRLKRVFFLSKLVISVNSLALMMLGFVLTGHFLSEFPRPLIAFVLVGFTLAINFIDLKDYNGDKHVGIQTVPVRLGLGVSKKLIATSFFMVYLGAFFVFSSAYWLIPLVLAATVQAVLINRKQYSEVPVFAVLLVSLVVLLVHLVYFAPDSIVTELSWKGIFRHDGKVESIARLLSTALE
jgi:4-hydroxybenzoate polyprenyltransferase